MLHHLIAFTILPLLLTLTSALNPDGTLLLSFKYSILSDPLSVLDNWDYSDPSPCSWTGVTCSLARVTGLVLPSSQLVGSIPEDLGLIEHLSTLDLSNNFLNGTFPGSLFNSSELKMVSLAKNSFFGELPEVFSTGLQVLNLSDNALTGKLPKNLLNSKNLTVLSLKSNLFSGFIPSGFDSVEILDLSSNQFNGSLPLDFGGDKMRFLNLSNNNLSGSVSLKFASKIPANSSVDLSFNNLSGEIPPALSDRKIEAFAGNLDLCGKPLKKLCSILSSISVPPNITTSSPAIAAIPRTIDSAPDTNPTQNVPKNEKNKLKLGSILGIIVGDLAGIGLLAMIFVYVYRLKKRKSRGTETGELEGDEKNAGRGKEVIMVVNKDGHKSNWPCLSVRNGEETSEGTISTTESDSDENNKNNNKNGSGVVAEKEQGKHNSVLIMVDGETTLELETLLKASAYILGSTGSTIVYKAVLQDGTAFAVRRIGEGGVQRLRDFEGHVRALAKLRHSNLVQIRGFYWGDDERLVIYDFVPNGSLASSIGGYRRMGSSPTHFPFEFRLKIAKGIARGLTYIHEKKHVHGNIKPSNILLTLDTEAVIADLGLERLLSANNNHKHGGIARHYGSKRSSASHESLHLHDLPISSTGMYPTRAGFMGCTSPYHAPESLENVKPSPKWDVYSFGVVLLEILTGRVFSDRELGQWTASSVGEDRGRVLRMVDVAIRSDMVDRENALLACLKLGFGCASLVPQKRPSMKEALQILEKIPCTNCH